MHHPKNLAVGCLRALAGEALSREETIPWSPHESRSPSLHSQRVSALPSPSPAPLPGPLRSRNSAGSGADASPRAAARPVPGERSPAAGSACTRTSVPPPARDQPSPRRHRRSSGLPAPTRSCPGSPSSGSQPGPCPVPSIPGEAPSTPRLQFQAEPAGCSPVPAQGGYPKGCKSPGAENPHCGHIAMLIPQQEPAGADGRAQPKFERQPHNVPAATNAPTLLPGAPHQPSSPAWCQVSCAGATGPSGESRAGSGAGASDPQGHQRP